jgi:hypothetical protein
MVGYLDANARMTIVNGSAAKILDGGIHMTLSVLFGTRAMFDSSPYCASRWTRPPTPYEFTP